MSFVDTVLVSGCKAYDATWHLLYVTYGICKERVNIYKILNKDDFFQNFLSRDDCLCAFQYGTLRPLEYYGIMVTRT